MLLSASLVFAGPNHDRLYLYEKDPVSWEVIEGGAWGMMKYDLSGSTFDFKFKGHGLVSGEDYTLIYYPDKIGNPWPRTDIVCLGSDIANAGGGVRIFDSADTGDLPNSGVDTNSGAKIWLVKTSAVDCGTNTMFGWDPTEYLFENNLITFDDTDTP